MKLPQTNKIKWNYPAIAFCLPVIGMLAVMMVAGVVPFGRNSMLYSDMYHQYFPFFKAFREALLSGDSLLYTWSVGMGMDYPGLIAYYLASPLYLLSVFIPESWVLPFFSMMVPLKLGLASLFFSIFLKKMFRKDDLSISLFGCFYALCAWALAYQWNVMWLDSFALLPLVALGTISLLRDRKFVLYTLTLFLSIYANYYIGFFVCIFVLLLFICYQICRCRSVGRFFRDLGRIALFSVIAIGMTAILTLPALASLQTTQSSVNNFPDYFSVNIVTGEAVTAAREAWNAYKTAKAAGDGFFSLAGSFLAAVAKSFPPLLDGMRQIAGNLSGGLVPSYKEGLPNLYCGVGTLILAFLFLTAKGVKLRDKICSVVMLVFLMLSFILRQLDYIWHGFHFTNMIPYRFSFLYSFILLYMAYRAYLMRRQFHPWHFLVAGGLSVAVMLCSNSRTKPVFLAYNGVFFLLYMAVFLYACWDRPLSDRIPRKNRMPYLRRLSAARRSRRMYAGIILAAVMVAELILNLVNFSVNFSFPNISNYPTGTAATASMVRYMKEREKDSLFYRAEVTHTQTLNDGALIGYNGITTFTSSANVRVTEFMKALGYSAKNTYNRYCFEESSPVANLFLNLKYMIERNGQVEDNSYFDEVHHYNNVYLLENNAYLPLGFLTEPELAELPFTSTSAFSFQNQLFTAATGISESVWNRVPREWLTITPKDVNIKTQNNGYCSYTAAASGELQLIYTYNIGDSGFLCLDLDMPSRNSYTVYKNGSYLYSESISLPQTIAVSDVAPGDVVEVRVTCKANENSNMTVNASLLDDRVFRAGYDILNASTLELTSFSNTKVEGTIHCNRDGLLYTSIPQNGGWRATVDGEEAEIVLVGDAMVALNLTEGTHTVTFTYHNDAFSLGWKVTLAFVLIFAGITFTVYWPRYKKRKTAPKA